MKTKTSITLAATLAAALASIASAQITPDPTGTNVFAPPSATNAALYNAALGAAGLNLYFASGGYDFSAEVATWAAVTGSAAITPGINWLAGGGTVKAVFLGESAGSANDFGFLKYGTSIADPNSYVPLATEIINPSAQIQSGWETLVNYGAGEKLDFWVNNPGTHAPGGAYFSFLLSNIGAQFAGGDPYTHAKFKWAGQDTHTNGTTNGIPDGIPDGILTEYQLPSGALTINYVPTLLIAWEDLRGPAVTPGQQAPVIPPGDADYTDFLVAFQFLTPQNAVPEPSTYGLMGAGALLGLVGYRRFKASKKAV